MKTNIAPALKVALFVLVFSGVAAIAYIVNGGWDWIYSFRPYSIIAASGKSPYGIDLPNSAGFFNPPWVLLLTVPLALLPGKAGGVVLALINAAGFAAASRSTGARWYVVLLILASPLVLYSVQSGNIDGLALAGLAMPPQIGLFFVLLKPQVGLCVALFWLVEAWRRGKIREVVRVFAPVSAAFLVSFIVFGPYLLNTSAAVAGDWNTSLFPYGIPVGIALLVYALRVRQVQSSVASSLLVSPYISFWGAAVVAIAPRPRATLLMFVSTWAAALAVVGVFLR